MTRVRVMPWVVLSFLAAGAALSAAISAQDNSRQTPPAGFVTLFNGKDLTGWKGLVADPPTSARMSPAERQRAQTAADVRMRRHWSVKDGVLIFDGLGDNLCTAQEYGNFELLIDWRIRPGGDSGIYLRGSPQVQIWDHADGSGGLYNNEKHPSRPLVKADHPVGEWNTFQIVMKDDRVTVRLNDTLVVDNVVMENYWERSKPIYTQGAIELQNHGNVLEFRNVFLRSLSNSCSPEAAATNPAR